MSATILEDRTRAEPVPTVPITSRRPLVVVCVLGAVFAATLAGVFHEGSAVPMAAQVTSPPPFGILHDLRWVLVFHASWLAFALEVVAMLAFRSAMTTAMLWFAWPADVVRPPLRIIAKRAVQFTVVLALAVTPWAAVLFAVGVVPVSWLFFVGVPATILVAVALHQSLGHPGAWRRLGPLRSTGWVVLSFVVLSIGAATIAAIPFPFSLVAVALIGLFNAWAWNGIVSAVVRPAGRRRVAIPAPAVIAVIAAVVVIGTAIGFDTHSASTAIRRTPSSARLDQPVMVVSGFGTSWDGDGERKFAHDGFERHFSYAGVDATGRPRPYTANDTRRSLSSLVASMDTQVRAFSHAKGQPISIVAESEGSLVAADYVATHPRAPVRRVVLLSPLIDPGLVYYPSRGGDGWGLATGWILRGFGFALYHVSSHRFPPDAPFFRSVLAEAPVLRHLTACFAPQTRTTVLFPLADAVAAPLYAQTDVLTVPAFHGGLLTNEAARRAVLVALRGRRPEQRPLLTDADVIIRAAASAWHVPPLPTGLNAPWRSFAGAHCPTAR